ncbi:MAG: hypothetical protein ABI662_11700 [Dermatophilaceae bacterium]
MLDSKWYRQKKLIVAFAICIAASLGAADRASNAAPDYLQPGAVNDRCDQPQPQRTGGWTCYGPLPVRLHVRR